MKEDSVRMFGLKEVDLPPFQRRDSSMSAMTTLRIVLLGILAPVRLVAGFTTLFFAYWILRLLFYGHKSYNYLSSWRRTLARGFVAIAARFMIFVTIGVWRLRTNEVSVAVFEDIQKRVREETRDVVFQTKSESTDTNSVEQELKMKIVDLLDQNKHLIESRDIPAATVVSNHVASMDPIAILSQFGVLAAAAKEEARETFIFGEIAQLLDVLFISKNNKKQIVEEMLNRTLKYYKSRIAYAKDPNADIEEIPPSFLIFPEGTTTAGGHLLKFYSGGFKAGAPVSPVIVHYGPYNHFNMGWTGNIATWRYMILHYSQIFQNMLIIRMPDYIPNHEEISNEMLYAENVRRTMCYAANTLLPDDAQLTLSHYLFNRYYVAPQHSTSLQPNDLSSGSGKLKSE